MSPQGPCSPCWGCGARGRGRVHGALEEQAMQCQETRAARAWHSQGLGSTGRYTQPLRAPLAAPAEDTSCSRSADCAQGRLSSFVLLLRTARTVSSSISRYPRCPPERSHGFTHVLLPSMPLKHGGAGQLQGGGARRGSPGAL